VHIILVSDRMATARTITLSLRHGVVALAGMAGLVLLVSSLFSFITLSHIEHIPLPFVQEILVGLRHQEAQKIQEKTQELVRENLKPMAVKLGEMQARIIRLDTLGERLAQLTGIKPQQAKVADQPARAPGRGGPLVLLPDALTANELQRQLDILSQQVESSGDYLGLLETEIRDERVRQNLLPTTLPVARAWDASSFGWRKDPFTGERALHEGVDFQADSGTPILAAAAGVVVAAEYHPAYGNMVEIDHGNNLTTRYAHASKLLVRAGTLVRRGQKIAEVGSSGRSTGPHLHFEVRVNGVAQNPARFLQAARDGLPLVAAKSK
jgi:murein DD-endopeptidase MepM/ murein hydrolase activator NlpD